MGKYLIQKVCEAQINDGFEQPTAGFIPRLELQASPDPLVIFDSYFDLYLSTTWYVHLTESHVPIVSANSHTAGSIFQIQDRPQITS